MQPGSEKTRRADSPVSGTLPPGLAESEKEDWFRAQFMAGSIYPSLKAQFTRPEIVKYLELYGRICAQFEDIVSTEELQILDFVRHRIFTDREAEEQKRLGDDNVRMHKWLAVNAPTDGPTNRNTAATTNRYEKMIADNRKTLKESKERYANLMRVTEKIQEGLAATRKTRIDGMRGGNRTFQTLVGSIVQSDSYRTGQGRFAELLRMAAMDINFHWRQPVEFPDGEVGPLVLDQYTPAEDEDGAPAGRPDSRAEIAELIAELAEEGDDDVCGRHDCPKPCPECDTEKNRNFETCPKHGCRKIPKAPGTWHQDCRECKKERGRAAYLKKKKDAAAKAKEESSE